MQTLETIKEKVKKLYESGKAVHIDVNMTHPRVRLENVPAYIKNVYTHIFRVETLDTSAVYTVQYTDVLINQVKIRELQDNF